jgi:RNA polymerase sigma-54 factor
MAVKACLRALIAGEDGGRPLTDLALVEAMRERGYVLARRTVAKYRGELAIPPCHLRADRRSALLGVDIPISLN